MPQLSEDIGFRKLYIALLLLIVVSLATSKINFFTIGEFDVLLIHRLFIMVLIGLFVGVIAHRSELRLYRMDIAILLFLSVMVVRMGFDAFLPYPMMTSITVVTQLCLMAGFYFAFGSYPASERETRILLRTWILVVLLVSIYGFYQLFARNLGLPLANLSFGSWYTAPAPLFGFHRPTSIFHEPTNYANFVLPACVFTTYLHLEGKATDLLFRSRRRNTLVVAFLWANFFFIASLGGYVALAATALIAAVINSRIRRLVGITAICATFVGTVVLVFGQQIELLYGPVRRISHFISSILLLLVADEAVGGSIGVRMVRLYWNAYVWIENPIFGIGINNIVYQTELTKPTWLGRTGLDVLQPLTHSIVGFTISSAGSMGLASYLYIYASAYRHVTHAGSISEPDFNSLAIVAVGYAVFVNFLLGFFSLPITHPLNWFLFGLLSILVGTRNSGHLWAGETDSPAGTAQGQTERPQPTADSANDD